MGLPVRASDKEPACQCRRCKRRCFDPCVRKMLWKRKLKLTLVFLLGESHEQRSLVGYSARGCKESDMTEATWRTCALLGIYCFKQNTEPTPSWLLNSWQDYVRLLSLSFLLPSHLSLPILLPSHLSPSVLNKGKTKSS